MPFTVPGEFAGIVEEVAPGKNTFEENGEIYAASFGMPVIDKAKRAVNIESPKSVRLAARGDVVLAIVTEIFDQVAQCRLISSKDKNRLAVPSNPYIRISELSAGYVDRMRDLLRTGDHILAEVIEVTELGTYLSIKRPNLGVIYAMCSQCRSDMHRSGSMFICENCGSKERRKIPASSAQDNRD